MSTSQIPARILPETRALTAAQFQGLAEVPPELMMARARLHCQEECLETV